MKDSLSKQLSDLAELLSVLQLSYKDGNAKELMDLQDRLIDLSNSALVKELQENEKNYIEAVANIQKAMTIIAKADKKIDTITKVVGIVSKVLESAAKALAVAL
jgi:uncharacterized protein YwgA